MVTVTLTEFRNRQSDYLAIAQREPVRISSRGVRPRAVVVSAEFFDRAVEALYGGAEIRTPDGATRSIWETDEHQRATTRSAPLSVEDKLAILDRLAGSLDGDYTVEQIRDERLANA